MGNYDYNHLHHGQDLDMKYFERKKRTLFVLVFLLILMITYLFASQFYFFSSSISLEDDQVKLNDPTEEFPYRSPTSWDISQSHVRTLSYTVTEGTWLNVDLSPDGKIIVFDIVGDLYTLPLNGGGVATLLKGGVAFDRQPRFSPDGSKILYTSDQSGCDNLWVMDLNTKVSTPVTDEPFRFVSNAAWASNSSHVVAVKWFTTSRSIPAGEIWSFKVNTNGQPDREGTKLIGRVTKDHQVGPEEPIISNDGRYVYFSQNRADSVVFEYSKDPHKGIYSISRLDLLTNSISTITGGSGGAARPVLSHDQKTLAFVRKTVFNTSLVSIDLETRNERIIYQGLSFDQQASSAPSGVYPYFAFTPDDQEIIVWAQGKIWRISISTGKAINIPFQVNLNLELAPTVRFPQDPSTGNSFQTKVTQGASLSKSNILFNSLGRTRIRSVSGGEHRIVLPNRNIETEFEFMATFAPNGVQGAHVVWNDVNLAKIELFSIDGSYPPFDVTTEKGRYSHPHFSPKGDQIVFTRLSGDSLSGPFYGSNSGIYLASLVRDGRGSLLGLKSEPIFITSGNKATFALDGISLLVERSGQVVQVNINNPSVQKVLVTGKYTTSISVSPDLTSVAFVDFYEVYYSPLILGNNGEPMTLSTNPDDYTPTMVRVSTNGGDFISWPSDGTTQNFYYLLGNQLSTVNIESIRKCQGDPDNYYGIECSKPFITQTDLTFTTGTNLPNYELVIDNAKILTMMGSEQESIIENGRILIQGERIAQIGTKDQVSIPSGAKVFDAQGGVVMPGFIDVHAHWSGTSDYYVQQSWEYLLNLAFGVTTLHNPSYDTIAGFSDAELVRGGLKIGPRLFSTGTIVYGAGGSIRCEVSSIEEARAALKRLKSYGAFSIKSYNQPCRSSRQMILEAARELGMNVVPEGGMAFWWNVNQIIDGHTTIEHALPVSTLYEDITELFAKSGTGYTPTFVVSYGGIYGENYWYQETDVWSNEKLLKFHPQRDVQSRSLRRTKSNPLDYNHFDIAKSVKKIHDKGGIVEPGAHGQRQGLGFHWELWMFSQGGMSNYEVLRTATYNSARSIGLQDLGQLKVGYLADIIIFDPNQSPLDNIFNTEKVKYVLKDAKLYETSTMDQLLPEFKKLPKGPDLNVPVASESNNNNNDNTQHNSEEL